MVIGDWGCFETLPKTSMFRRWLQPKVAVYVLEFCFTTVFYSKQNYDASASTLIWPVFASQSFFQNRGQSYCANLVLATKKACAALAQAFG
jgi:hypothetical protein